MTNLCRDEVTVPLKDKIESVFGGSFNTNGLGGVLTCGVTGIGAGLSHSPVSVSVQAGGRGKKRQRCSLPSRPRSLGNGAAAGPKRRSPSLAGFSRKSRRSSPPALVALPR